MRIHILGICGTFMGGVALLAKEMGHQVSGSDLNIYPPMSTLLMDSGIKIHEGYDIAPLTEKLDSVIIGNTLSRGNESVEYVLNQRIPYISGPEWLSNYILQSKQVIAVSGTHGKTSTTSMLAWVLECAGKLPGFLIGGVAENFGLSARLGESDYFVVEADEYDTAFFDKRSKFIHYHPRILIINNIEYDHADIFGDIGDIIREFRRLIRIVPEKGAIVIKSNDVNIDAALEGDRWTPIVCFGECDGDWQILNNQLDYSKFDVSSQGEIVATVNWDLIGLHNAENALAVTAAAFLIGISPRMTAEALSSYKSVKRRMQKLGVINEVTVYDDFAHHPSAISTTLSALRANVGDKRIIAIFEPRSNTMKMGVHKDKLAQAFNNADLIRAYKLDGLEWDMNLAFQDLGDRYRSYSNIVSIIDDLAAELTKGDHVVIMSNGSFQGIHQKLIDRLKQNRK
jgi:UDP-N-acetylmuramate: L-alanyl-gamma-D-glutamyl-meso-diaminopimelate ligase